MPASRKPRQTRTQTRYATVTSKGQVTIPIDIRKSLGVKAGDKLRFESDQGAVRVARAAEENPFEKWRGIGSFPGMGQSKEAIVAYFRNLRGHDDLD